MQTLIWQVRGGVQGPYIFDPPLGYDRDAWVFRDPHHSQPQTPCPPRVGPRGDTQQGLTAKDMNEPESSQPLSGQGGRD